MSIKSFGVSLPDDLPEKSAGKIKRLYPTIDKDDLTMEAWVSILETSTGKSKEDFEKAIHAKLMQYVRREIKQGALDYDDIDDSNDDSNLDINIIDIKDKIKLLNHKEQQLIILYYYNRLTLQEIATLENVTKSCIHKKIYKILKKMETFVS